MFEIKMNKNGQIKIPKAIRDCFEYKEGTIFKADVYGGVLKLEPLAYCRRCGKALPNEFKGVPTCSNCPPNFSFTFR
ncbi:MAG: AbrB/MazE/SpoVT family DNA-binding domain-containing protein [Clostridia bacterium]|nr:AbrB/MazE/SpoVT family DNA-binding domain-containing protein [Clostridia bacterium]